MSIGRRIGRQTAHVVGGRAAVTWTRRRVEYEISLGRVPAGLWADCKTDGGGGVVNRAWSHFSVIFSTVFTEECAGFSVERKFTQDESHTRV